MSKPLWELRENHETRAQGEGRMIALSKQKTPESILILGNKAFVVRKIIGYTCYSAKCGQVEISVGLDTIVQYPDSTPTNAVISVNSFFNSHSLSPSVNVPLPVDSYSKGYPLADMSELQDAVNDAVDLCMERFFKKLDGLHQDLRAGVSIMNASAWSITDVKEIPGGVKAKKLYRNGKGDIIKVRRKHPKTGAMDCMIIKPSNHDFYWGSYDVDVTGKVDKTFSINISGEGEMSPGEVSNMIRSMSLVAQVEEYIVPGRGTTKYRDVVKKTKKT